MEAADALDAAVSAALSAAGVPHRVQRAGTLLSVLFGEFSDPPRGYAEVQRQNTAQYGAFFHAMLDAGVSLPPSAYETWFVSAAHDDAALDRVVRALPEAARRAARA
jgi:glutamate-1-semialdehyde 2,1-aminomutase